MLTKKRRVRPQPVSAWFRQLLANSRPAEERGVAIVVYDPAWAAWQAKFDPVLTALRRLRETREMLEGRAR